MARMSGISGWLPEIRFADVADVALVTTLLYTAVALIRRTQAAFVAIGILMLGGLYIAARALDLRLTAWIFQGFFAVLLVILVVIFQEELRQLFERIALSGLRRRRADPPLAYDSSDILVKCLSDFARDRTGALVVLAGRQPVDRHVQGGIALDGRLSEPLLKSIFDAHSPGHDGAVIVEGDRVTRFATQLPLSTDFRQLVGLGTRHGAALGLAERSDALCLVVSEERGRVSVARQGRLRPLGSPQQLGAEVQEFVRGTRPRGVRDGWIALLSKNWIEKLACLALVIGLWYLFVPGSRPSTFMYEVPVRVVNLPPDLVLEAVDPSVVTVVFSGRRRAFYLFDPSELIVTVDASLAAQGRRSFRVSADDIEYPNGLTLEEVRPSRVRIVARETAALRRDAPAYAGSIGFRKATG
jgi:diadenylate cyclase